LPALVLAGEEEFLLYRKLEELKEKLLDPAFASFNYQRLDGAVSGSDVVDLAASIPFGPGNKVIIFDRCDWFAKKRAGKSDDKPKTGKGGKASGKDSVDEDKLAEALAGLHPSTYLIFVATQNFDSTLRLSKLVAQHAKVEKFDKFKHWAGGEASTELKNFVQKEVHHFGATIDEDAAYYLIDGLEANLRHIHKEIEKAATYILPQTHITLDVVKRLSPHNSQIFAVTEYWLAGKHEQTLNSLRELLSKQNAMGVIAALQTLLSKWVQIKTLCEVEKEKLPYHPGVQRRDLPSHELAKRLQGSLKAHPFALEKDIKRLQPVSLDFLIRKRQDLTRMEQMVKTGLMPDLHALELFFFGEEKRRQ